jgi:integrase
MVELICDAIRARRTKGQDVHRPIGDSLLVAVMSYAGLRPAEALALRFGDIGEHTISVDKAVADGVEVPTKTRRARVVPLVQPLRQDLYVWRWLLHEPTRDEDLVFSSVHGGLWTRTEFGNWRNRVWKPAVCAIAGSHPRASWLVQSRPYHCRGTFVSLQLRRTPLRSRSPRGPATPRR